MVAADHGARLFFSKLGDAFDMFGAASVLCQELSLTSPCATLQDTMVALQEEYLGGHLAGLDMETGDPIDPADAGIWDNFRVKRQLLNSWYVLTVVMCPTRHPAMDGLGLGVSHCTIRAGASLAAESYYDHTDATGQIVMISRVQNTWCMLCLFKNMTSLHFIFY
jgi:hypothetical protein